MRVLHLIGSFDQGGSERQALQLARLQVESGAVEVKLACFDEGGVLQSQAEELIDGKIPSFPLTSFYNFKTLQQLRRFSQYLRAQHIDVVHTHDFYTNVFGISGASLAGVNARVASRRETFGFRTENQKRVERTVYRAAHAIVANAEAVKHQLIAEGVNAEKIFTIHNGIDASRVQPPASLSRADAMALFDLPSDPDGRFVTIVANMHHPVKDQSTFLRAAKQVREQCTNVGFILAGEGDLQEELRALAKELGIEKDVFFIGRCERLAELLYVSDVCVLSSTAEGFSNSILEYMAAGKPVVATDVGGAREAIIEGETGYLVSKGDDQSMADRIIQLLNDPDKASLMGQNGKQIVQNKFSCDAQLQLTTALYERLLASKQTSKDFKDVGAQIG